MKNIYCTFKIEVQIDFYFWHLDKKLIDLLLRQQTKVEDDIIYYPAAQDIAKQIMQLLNSKIEPKPSAF